MQECSYLVDNERDIWSPLKPTLRSASRPHLQVRGWKALNRRRIDKPLRDVSSSLLACLLPAHAGRDQTETRPEEHHACGFWILTLDGAAGALVDAG
jgi:hypothetical protein